MEQREDHRPNLIITGFMGAGKTAIGREVAARLGRPFVDMDTAAETRAGKSIPRIFAEDGEGSFREIEAALCEELSLRGGYVIATGGGTLVAEGNRRCFLKKDTVVCLEADVGAIMDRVGNDPGRPLLDVDDRSAEIERLLSRRQGAYADVPWHVDTSNLSVAQVADRVIALAEARSLTARHPEGAYDIHIGEGMLDHTGGALRTAGVPAGSRVALVTNDVVGPLYAQRARQSLSASNLEVFLCRIPDGEKHKTLNTAASLYDLFLAGGLDRSGLVVSLGGGVTGDIAGFAAATYMRGVRFAQIPTTVLSMVDASVGGKTGVDLAQGKNLVGAFLQPAAVVIDPSVLSTLDRAEIRSGMAEVIKHGIIGAPHLFAELEAAPMSWSAAGDQSPPLTGEQLARALRVKIEIVEKDPYEHGERAVLNLGHTVGHALERLSGYGLRHGEAVAIGMAAAARIAAALGTAEPGLPGRLQSLLIAWGLPVECPTVDGASIPAERIWQAMSHDKKRRGDTLRWVLPLAVGRVTIAEDVPKSTVLLVLRHMGAA